jgi:AcrR family transcriptional regulator
MAYYRDDKHGGDSRSKRQQILAAAYDVFSRKGYHRATVDEIIALADTGKGTVYNYFNNKEQLFYTLVREKNQPFEAALQQAADSDQPPTAKLEAMVRIFLRFYQENADLWRVMMHEMRGYGSEDLSFVKAETREKYREVLGGSVRFLAKAMKDGVDQGVLREVNVTHAAYVLYSAVVTMAFNHFIVDVDSSASELTDIFQHGMARR